MKNIKKFLEKPKSKVLGVLGGLSLALTGVVPAYAAEGDAEYITGIQSLWQQLTVDMNVATVAKIIGIVIGACVGAVLFWFGLRYVTRKIQTAIKSGKFKA